MQADDKCVCCRNRLGDNRQFPMPMNCGHIMCMSCVLLKKAQNQQAQSFTCACPRCQATHTFYNNVIEMQMAMLDFNEPQDK